MKLRAIARIFTRRTASILLLLALGALGGVATLVTATPRYDATATVLLVVRPAGTPYEALAGTVYASTRIASYGEVALSPVVLTPVIQRLDLDLSADELAARVKPTIDVKGLRIDLVASSADPTEASDIANAVAAQLAIVVEEQLEANSTSQGSVLDLRVIREALPPTEAAYPLPAPSIVLGLAVGALMALGVTLLREVGERAVRTVGELRDLTELPIIGRIGTVRHRANRPLEALARDPGHAREFESLYTAVRFSRFESPARSTLVTAPDSGSGSTTVAVSLAMVMARAGHRTVLVDANLTAPGVADYFDRGPAGGVSDVVIRRIDYRQLLPQVPGHTNLWVLGAGARVPNPHDVLASPRFARLIQQLELAFDEVVIDSAPIGEHLQSATVAESAGASVLVVGMRSSTRDHVSRAIRALEAASSPIAGIVVNRIRTRGRDEGHLSQELGRKVLAR